MLGMAGGSGSLKMERGGCGVEELTPADEADGTLLPNIESICSRIRSNSSLLSASLMEAKSGLVLNPPPGVKVVLPDPVAKLGAAGYCSGGRPYGYGGLYGA